MIISVLPACKSNSPSPQSGNVEQMTGYLTLQDGRLIEYGILIPRSWTEEEKFEYRKDGNVNYYDYTANPKHNLFVIAAFPEVQWQETRKELKYSEVVFSQEGIVIVYNVVLDNPYTGAQADDFQQMLGQVKSVAGSLTTSIISTSDEMERARNTLLTFFDKLSTANYAEAAGFYGGTYENLIEMNPTTDPNDRAALLEQACTINGFKCLQVKEVVHEEQTWPDLFTFILEFMNPDGNLFVLYDCCGPRGLEKPIQSRFEYRVGRVPQLGNVFLVQTLPVYMP
jgi:hypothetical protein